MPTTACNKTVLNGVTLIDLTADTVDSAVLLKGYTAHKADGTIITGSLFDGYAPTITLRDSLTDESDLTITDSSGNAVEGATVYAKL